MLTIMKWSTVVACSLFVAGGLMGCKKSAEPETTEQQEQKEVAAVEELPKPVMDPANEEVVKMKLSLADLADGTSDKIIHKCPVCMLRMNGSEKFAVEYAGYNVHLCSEYCKETFEEDPKAAILALKVDE